MLRYLVYIKKKKAKYYASGKTSIKRTDREEKPVKEPEENTQRGRIKSNA